MFADVRTYWSGESVKRVTGYELEGHAKEADGFIHLINSGACCVDACGEVKDEKGNAVMKKWWEVTDKDIDTMMGATTWPYADLGYFRGGGYSSRFVTRAEMPATMIRLNLIKGLGPVLQIVEGWTVKLPDEVTDKLWKRTDYTWPCTWFAPRVTGKGAFKSAYDVMNNLSVIAEHAALGTNLGMLTDSRSFSSYVRFDYFRRILASYLGEAADAGEFTEKEAIGIARKICYFNVKETLKI